MSLLVERATVDEFARLGHLPALAVRIEKVPPPQLVKMHPRSDEEPVSVRFSGRAGLRSAADRFEGAADLIVTRRRLIVVVRSGISSPGLNQRLREMALLTVDREDLQPATAVSGLLGKTKRVELRGASADFVITVPFLPNFAAFLEAMRPEYVAELGDERADEIEARERREREAALEAARRAEAEEAERAASRFATDAQRTNASPSGRIGASLGVFDHLSTWHYRVAAPPGECVRAFAAAFENGGGLFLKGSWELERAPDSAVATYQGRSGLAGLATPLFRVSAEEEAGATGSQVRFEAKPSEGAYTVCAMWLAERTTRLGFTNDGRFFRPHMRAVERELRRLDPDLQLVKE